MTLERANRQIRTTRISAVSGVGGRLSPFDVAASVALHGLIIAAMMVTFSRHLDIVDQSSPIVPVDLVTLSNKTNVRASERVPPKIAPEIKPTPPPVEDNTPPPPDQATSEPLIVKPPPLPTPTQKPQEKPKKAEDKFDLDKLDALLNKVAPTVQRTKASNRTIKGSGLQDAMTADLVSLLASKVAACYTPPTGVPHPEELIVDFDVLLNPDGSVARAPQFLGQTSNPYALAGKEAALRAIYECAPYKLPPDRYDQWREINPFHFDPRTFAGD